uniref:rRNA N-glycosidase n=1 Tax=Oryza nivara TaxID=4536 RepID=A0A0E0JBQ9_ORYNI
MAVHLVVESSHGAQEGDAATSNEKGGAGGASCMEEGRRGRQGRNNGEEIDQPAPYSAWWPAPASSLLLPPDLLLSLLAPPTFSRPTGLLPTRQLACAESKEETGAASPIKNAIKNAAAGEMAEEEKLAGAASPLLRLRSARGETGTAIKNAAAGEMGEEETAAMGITRTRGDQETPRKKKGRSWRSRNTKKRGRRRRSAARVAGRRARPWMTARRRCEGKRERSPRKRRMTNVCAGRWCPGFEHGFVSSNQTRRYRRMKRICCMTLAGAPVTPPTTMRFDHPAAIARPQDVTTFHIVDTDGARVRLLFRDSDLYFVAFKTGSCWFRFNDEHIPTFLTPTVPIAYTSGYMNIAQVRVGYHCLYDIFNVISRYTPESAQEKTNERQRILQCAALMLSESQRFGHVQLLVKRQIHKMMSKKITAKQNKKIHSWGSIARYCISHECKEDVLHHLSTLIVLFNPDQNKYENYKIVGRRKLLSRAAAAAEEAAARAAEAAARPSQAAAAEEEEEEEDDDDDEDEYPWQCQTRAGQELLILLYDKDCVPKAIRSGGHRVRLPPPLQAEDETNKQKMMIKKKNTHHPAVPSSSDNVEDLPTVSAPPVTPMVVTQQKNHKKTQAEEVDEKKNQENPNTDATIGAPSGGENQQNRSLISCDGINLYESDLDSLRGPHWVTDAILGYALAKFSRAYSDDGLLLVQPTNAALLNNKHYVAAAEADHLLLASRRLVLIPVNDNLDFNQAGDGKHWSLLVIHKTSNDGVIQFIHHDSVRSGDNSYNLHAAQKLANVLRGVLPTAGDVINAETPQQTNGNDCAIHVLAAVQVICGWWRANANKSGPADWIRKLDKRISEGNITQMRASLLQDIERDCQKKKSKDQ